MISRVSKSCRKLLLLFPILGLFVSFALFLASPAHATSGINQQVNFQGRLLNAQGATVPDGYYNIEFKVYQDGDGLTAGDTTGSPAGTLKWTEDYMNVSSKGVQVKNGYMSVQLGSITPFGTSVDWNQNTLWLSINIGGTNPTCATFSACTPDGEMVPMKRLSSTPYSLNSGLLGGIAASGFIQNTTTVQSANIAVQSSASGNIAALIQGAASQTADIFQVKATGTTAPLLAVSSAGSVTVQPVSDSTTAFSVKTSLGNNVLTVDSLNARVGIGLGGSNVPGLAGSGVEIQGALRLTGGAGLGEFDLFTSPVGSSVGTKINIPVYNPGAYGQVLAFGVPSSADTTSRVLSLFDARTAAHQPTLSVFSPDEANVFGLSWDGSNSIGYIKNTASTVSVQGGGLSLITATKNGSSANVGIGNGATSGYALDVTGDINSSTQYRLSGTTILTNTALTFSGAGTSNIQSTAGQSLNLNGSTSISLQTNSVTRATLDNANGIYFGNGVTAAAPNNFTISGTGSSATAVAGGSITVQGGNATVGNANGGNLTLSGGSGLGTGSNGLVVIKTPTFSTTANDPNCYTGGALVAASCTIAASSVNNSAAILVGFNTTGQTSTLPNPTNATAGRVIYITAANGSNDFTLLVNGGGIGNLIAMRQNTTATMIWNGSAWTAAGASSSTTLQSSYDNTLQSAGGAELIVSHTSTTNGLTIRDSSVNPVNGTLLSVQTASAAGLLSVNGNVTEYSSDSGAEVVGTGGATSFPTNTWAAVGASTVTRYSTAGNFIATGQASASVVTTTAANIGIKNTLSTALNANTHYNVSFTTRLTSGTFTDMNVYYSVDGTTASVPCTPAASVTTSIWTKVNCAFAAPASGITTSNAILIRQTAAGTARTFYIDNLSVTIAADYNYATDGGVDDSINFATDWNSVAGAGVTRSTTVGNDASDSAQVTTTGTGQGVNNQLSINPLQNTLYRITVYAASTTAGFNSFTVRYSRDNGTNFVSCADYNTQAISSSVTGFTKVTCYITTDGTAPTNPAIFFTQSDATGRTFYVDTFSMTLSTNSTPNVQIGGGVNGGPVTLLTLDRGASAPIASNNDALLGSMYYDTTLGKLQCYESDGWGACGSSPDNVITISPEFTNAVMHGTGVGTMTSDICSSTLNINDGTSGQSTICGANETYNFYKWTSPQASAQTYSIYVTYQLPNSFKTFASGQTSIMGRTDSSNATVQYQVYRNDSTTGLLACGASVPVSTGVVTSWQTGIATGATDPSTCGFAPGDSIVFKISVTASLNANAYIGNLNFIFSNK